MIFLLDMHGSMDIVKELAVLASRLGGQEEQRVSIATYTAFRVGQQVHTWARDSRTPNGICFHPECILKRLARRSLRI